jgi:hypothetical protein
LLAQNDINVLGYSLSAEGRTGTAYLLCSNHARAFTILETKYHFYCSRKNVLIVKAAHKPGTLYKVIKLCAQGNLNLGVSYQAYLTSGFVLIVLELDTRCDAKSARRILTENGLEVLDKMPDE